MGDVRFQQLDDLLLLPTREARHVVEELAEFAGWRTGAFPARRVAEEFFHRHAQGFGHRHQHIGSRQGPAGFPVADVGLLLPDQPREFPLRESGGFTKRTKRGQ